VPTLAIDIGGTKTAAALVEGGRVLERREVATPPAPGADALLGAAEAAARPLLAASAGGPVGVASAGLAVGGSLRAVNTATFRLPEPVPFAAMLGARLGGRPVRLLNDGTAAAWGEHRHGAGRGAASLVFVTISTGVGGGLVVDGRPLSGRQGLAGHLGFLGVAPDGPACGSGRRGTLESLASGRAIERDAAVALGRPVSARELFGLRGRDPRADAVIGRAAEVAARALADLAALLDPDLVVVGGGVGLAPGYLGLVEAALAREPALFRPPLAPAALGADAGLVGAADWAARPAEG
jgi:predicted NBD/HSP70 family sugar kinase